jgi:hypothetical protein
MNWSGEPSGTPGTELPPEYVHVHPREAPALTAAKRCRITQEGHLALADQVYLAVKRSTLLLPHVGKGRVSRVREVARVT